MYYLAYIYIAFCKQMLLCNPKTQIYQQLQNHVQSVWVWMYVYNILNGGGVKDG